MDVLDDGDDGFGHGSIVGTSGHPSSDIDPKESRAGFFREHGSERGLACASWTYNQRVPPGFDWEVAPMASVEGLGAAQ